MLDRDAAVKTARDASEAIRMLNHATLNHGDYSAPEISDMVGSLAEMTERLPQLLRQLVGQLEKREDEGKVRMEDGEPPAWYVGRVMMFLGDARRELQGTALSLRGACSQLSRMGAPWPEGDE